MLEATQTAETFGAGKTGDALDQLCADTLRTLSMDGVEQANSGHPGMPMGMADVADVLWREFLTLDPKDPHWPGRDRFVLSAGHGSMLLYSLLHLSGYPLAIEDLKKFRQVDSKTPGHPESFMTAGVETTTGPLGQGFGNAVGMAIVERNLAARYDASVVGHRTFVILGDGCLMEGVSAEAASLAGHLGLGRLVCLWDDNHISIDGSTDLAFTEDVLARFQAYGWRTERVDGHDRAQVRRALSAAVAQEEKPTLIACRTIIGKGAPTKQGTEKVHGSPLGKDELKKTKEIMGWPLEPTFLVPSVVKARWAARQADWAKARAAWDAKAASWRAAKPADWSTWQNQLSGELPVDLEKVLPVFDPAKDAQATRAAGGKALNAVYGAIPGLMGGSADLTESNSTHIKAASAFTKKNPAGRYIHFGVREHGMGAILNGMALHGGAIPFGAGFLVFSDYMRGSIRLAALSHLRVIYVFTHDSIFLGEDGPTHQPVEHMAALRAIPNLAVIRPGDPSEAAWSWKAALDRRHGPTALVLTRQKLPVFERSGPDACAPASHLLRGGYTLWESAAPAGAAGRTGAPDLVLIGTGSELSLALEAARVLAKEDGLRVRVVSMPSWELFEQQDENYRRSVIPRIPGRVAIEAMRTLGWERYVGEDGLVIGMSGFGASGSDKQLAEKFGFTVPAVLARVRAWRKGLPAGAARS